MKGRKRLVVGGAVILAAGALLYTVAVPSAIARNYLERSDRELAAVSAALNRAASSTQAPVFNNPDVSALDSQKQLDDISARIRQTQKALDEFERSSRLRIPPGTGFANNYRAAAVRQEQSRSIVSQSRQVLDEYSGLVSYLQIYTDLQARLDDSLQNFNSIGDFNIFGGRGSIMFATATLIEGYEIFMRPITPPAGFNQLHQEALASLASAKDGFNRLGTGLDNRIDGQIYQAAGQLEAVTAKNQISDKTVMVSLADKSPILQTATELPEKTEHARGL